MADGDGFEGVVSDALREPALSPSQADFVDAMISRLRGQDGDLYPLNKYDFANAISLAYFLGLTSLGSMMTAQYLVI